MNQLVTFGISVLLARILSPEEFGLAGIVIAFIAIVNSIADLGFGGALMQKQHFDDHLASSIFYVNIAIGLMAALALQFISPVVAGYYEDLNLVPLIRGLSFILLISPLQSLLTIRLAKKIREDIIVQQRFLASVVSGVVGVILALNDAGVMSLIVQNFVQRASLTFFLWYKTRWLPRYGFHLSSIRNVWNFSVFSFLANLVSSIFDQIDVMFIGKVLSPQTLGFYYRAKSLDNFVVSYSSASIGSVLFPYVAKYQTDREQIRVVYLKVFNAVLFVSCCLSLMLFLVSDQLIPTLFGPKWFPSILMFKYLSVVGFSYPISAVIFKTILGLGGARANFFLNLTKRLSMLLPLGLAYSYGILGFLQGYVAVSVFTLILNVWWSSRWTGISLSQQIWIMFRNVLLAVCVGFCTHLLHSRIGIDGPILSILIISAISFTLYVALGYLLNFPTMGLLVSRIVPEIRRILRK